MRIISLCLVFAVGLGAQDLAIEAFAAGRYKEAQIALDGVAAGPQKDLLQDLLLLARGGCGAVEAAQWPQRIEAAGGGPLERMAVLAAVPCMDATAAIAALEKVDQKKPGDADVLYAKARFHLKAWNDAVFQMYQRAPGSWRVNQLSGEILEIQGKLAEAEAEFRKAIEKNPTALNVHFRLGRMLLLQAQGKEGLEAAGVEFAKELALNPADAAAEFQLGQIANVNANRTLARRHWESALRLNDKFGEAALALAKLEMEEKRFVQAIALLEPLVERQPKNEAAQYNLMLSFRNSGQLDKARQRKLILDQLQRPPEGEFNDFLKRLGDKPGPLGAKP